MEIFLAWLVPLTAAIWEVRKSLSDDLGPLQIRNWWALIYPVDILNMNVD